MVFSILVQLPVSLGWFIGFAFDRLLYLNKLLVLILDWLLGQLLDKFQAGLSSRLIWLLLMTMLSWFFGGGLVSMFRSMHWSFKFVWAAVFNFLIIFGAMKRVFIHILLVDRYILSFLFLWYLLVLRFLNHLLFNGRVSIEWSVSTDGSNLMETYPETFHETPKRTFQSFGHKIIVHIH